MPEVYEYEDDTIPHHVAAHYRQLAHDRALRLLDIAMQKSERHPLNDDEMRQLEPGQNFGIHNFF